MKIYMDSSMTINVYFFRGISRRFKHDHNGLYRHWRQDGRTKLNCQLDPLEQTIVKFWKLSMICSIQENVITTWQPFSLVLNVPSDPVPSLPQSGPRRDESPDISPSPQIGLSPDDIQLCVANQWIAAPWGPIMVAFPGVHRPNGITNGTIMLSILNKSIHFTWGLQTINSTGRTGTTILFSLK